jgi:hypothetical protein
MRHAYEVFYLRRRYLIRPSGSHAEPTQSYTGRRNRVIDNNMNVAVGMGAIEPSPTASSSASIQRTASRPEVAVRYGSRAMTEAQCL